MSSVRDRVQAAEARTAAEEPSKRHHVSARRGHKLSLKTDEHIKEEILRRSDGGWHKNIDIEQHDQRPPEPMRPPVIKLTSETPIAKQPRNSLPGKLGERDLRAFASVEEESPFDPGSDGNDDWKRVEDMEAAQQAAMDADLKRDWEPAASLEVEQQAAMDAEASTKEVDASSKSAQQQRKDSQKHKSRHTHDSNAAKDLKEVPGFRLAKVAPDHSKDRAPFSSEKRKSKSPPGTKHARVDDQKTENGAAPDSDAGDAEAREQVLFDPVEYAEKKQARRERKVARAEARMEQHIAREAMSETARSRSPSIGLFRFNHDDDNDAGASAQNIRRERSRSCPRSSHERLTPEQEPRSQTQRPSSFLWPSFSGHRRSMSDFLEKDSPRRRSHSRHHSDNHSVAGSTHSVVSERKLEFAEYIAGKKLDQIPLVPPKSPLRPMGFVRSRSHTGEYSEGYTRNKALLRKPEDDEAIDDEYSGIDIKHRDKMHYRAEQKKHKPWQMRVMQEVLRH